MVNMGGSKPGPVTEGVTVEMQSCKEAQIYVNMLVKYESNLKTLVHLKTVCEVSTLPVQQRLPNYNTKLWQIHRIISSCICFSRKSESIVLCVMEIPALTGMLRFVSDLAGWSSQIQTGSPSSGSGKGENSPADNSVTDALLSSIRSSQV